MVGRGGFDHKIVFYKVDIANRRRNFIELMGRCRA